MTNSIHRIFLSPNACLISYILLINHNTKTFDDTAEYTHQIYINLFINQLNNMQTNHKMYEKRDYVLDNKYYGELFANKNQLKCNEYEAHIALKYIKKFIIELGNKEREIAVLSDYRAQIECMQQSSCNINTNEILLC
eukprot:41165_1